MPKHEENTDHKDHKHTFITGLDSPAYRGADGTFVSSPDAPEYPISDGLSPRTGPSDSDEDAPEFTASDGATSLEGPEGGLETSEPSNIDATPVFKEIAADGQTSKQDAVDDPQSNIRQDYIAELELAKEGAEVTPDAVDADDAVEVDADAQGVGEARAEGSVEQADPDKAVARHNADADASAKGQSEYSKDQDAQDVKAKADAREDFADDKK